MASEVEWRMYSARACERDNSVSFFLRAPLHSSQTLTCTTSASPFHTLAAPPTASPKLLLIAPILSSFNTLAEISLTCCESSKLASRSMRSPSGSERPLAQAVR